MVQMMEDEDKRLQDSIEGFGDDTPDALVQNATRTVCFSPLSGLLKQNKNLPIRYCPLQFEFEIVSNVADAVSGSTAFTINNVQLKADILTLDNYLENEISGHLLSGKSLPIHYSTWTTASQINSITHHISKCIKSINKNESSLCITIN